MVAHIAFLRAINVGSRRIKMETLKEIFESFGLDHVETFIASGNVIFESENDASSLEEVIETGLRDALGWEVATFLRTFDDIDDLLEQTPFEGSETANVYASFLTSAPDKAVIEKVEGFSTPTDSFSFYEDHLFWRCEGPSHKSKFSNAKLERALGSPATNRNVKTLHRLLEKRR